MQIILLSSDTQLNITISWRRANDQKMSEYLWMGIYTQEHCELQPELKDKTWSRCVNFTAEVPTWHIVEKKFIYPVGPKLGLEYRVHKNSG